MTNPIDRFRRQSATVKVMLIIIILLILGIIMRWDHVGKEASEAIKRRFVPAKGDKQYIVKN